MPQIFRILSLRIVLPSQNNIEYRDYNLPFKYIVRTHVLRAQSQLSLHEEHPRPCSENITIGCLRQNMSCLLVLVGPAKFDILVIIPINTSFLQAFFNWQLFLPQQF